MMKCQCGGMGTIENIKRLQMEFNIAVKEGRGTKTVLRKLNEELEALKTINEVVGRKDEILGEGKDK